LREAWELLVPPVDLRGTTDDPVEVFYRVGRSRFLVDVPLERCRAFGATAQRCTREANNPFVDTLVLYGQGRCTSFLESPLHRYYETWQPDSLAEAMGIPADPANQALSAPPVVPALPWSRSRTGLERARRLALQEFRAAQRRAGVDGGDVDGILSHGPVTPAFGAVTFERLAMVYDSIRWRGYQPEKVGASHIMAQLLMRDGEHRIFIRSGKHRIAALGALGYTRVTVQLARRYFPALIHREDASSWPLVRSGLYTRDQAVALFDRIFDGQPPPGCDYRSDNRPGWSDGDVSLSHATGSAAPSL
jgi:hypothetical protein